MQDKYNKQVALLVKCLPIIETEHCFAIKGGTAINLFYLNLPRLSVDIDLVYLPIENRQSTIENIHDALMRISSRLERLGLTVQSSNKQEEKLVCSDGVYSIKIEPNYISRGYIYEPNKMELCQKAQELFGYAQGLIISEAELWGGKICAALDRQHPRDLFDISNLLKQNRITNEIKNGFIASLMSASRPMHEILAPNFHLLEETIAKEFRGMSDGEFSIQDAKLTFERLIKEIIEAFTEDDRKMLIDFVQLKADLSSYPIPNLNNLPGIKWKEQNIRNLSQKDNKKFQEMAFKLKEVLS